MSFELQQFLRETKISYDRLSSIALYVYLLRLSTRERPVIGKITPEPLETKS